MGLLTLLLLILVVFTFVGIFGASRGAVLQPPPATQGDDTWRALLRPNSKAAHIVVVDSATINEDRDHWLILTLHPAWETDASQNLHTPGIGISVHELEECIRWVPYNTKICIASRGGFPTKLMRRLRKLDTHRSLYLLAEVRDITSLSGTKKASSR
jgi:hypothetical protein